MTATAHLLADCQAAGIRLLPQGSDRLTIDAPEGKLTPELIQRVKNLKAELLETLRGVRPDDDPPPMEDGPADDVADDWPETIRPNQIWPCPKCGLLEVWENMRGDWRCLKCDPPTRWRAFAARQSIPAQ